MSVTQSWTIRALALVLMAMQVPVLIRAGTDVSQSDFANYFVPAHRLAHGGSVGALYGRDAFEEEMADAGLTGLGSFVPHLPANALWLLPMASLDPEMAKGVWTAALVLALGVTVWAVAALWPGAGFAAAIVIVLLPMLAIRNGLAFGQPYIILSMWLTLGALAWQRSHTATAGFLLGLGVSFKPYAIVLSLLFLHRDCRRALLAFVGGAAAPSLLLLAIAGPEPFVEFGTKVLPWMMRAEIQDPFSAGWGSASALVQRLLRFEPDLNPSPWIDLPILARVLAAAIPGALLALGTICGWRALQRNEVLSAVGVVTLFAVAASPFAASYHIVLLTVSMVAVATRLHRLPLLLWFTAWLVVGSPLINFGRGATGLLAPLAYARFVAIAAMGVVSAWPWLNRRALWIASAWGLAAGAAALPIGVTKEAWPRVTNAHGYSMIRPSFCGNELRWMSPSADGRRLELMGAQGPCAALSAATREPAAVVSRFIAGSFNLYMRLSRPGLQEVRLTFSDANEIDPVLTPEGCAVVFASDQGRGLGSYALYRLDLSGKISGCEKAPPVEVPQ